LQWPQSGALANAYLKIDTSSAAGAGLTADSMQFRGTADTWGLNGATTVATLYSDATTATHNPAVTVRSLGTNRGEAAALTYDLTRSVIQTRQGNPAWAGDERAAAAGRRRPAHSIRLLCLYQVSTGRAADGRKIRRLTRRVTGPITVRHGGRLTVRWKPSRSALAHLTRGEYVLRVRTGPDVRHLSAQSARATLRLTGR
jgi:hypothetical protein